MFWIIALGIILIFFLVANNAPPDYSLSKNKINESTYDKAMSQQRDKTDFSITFKESETNKPFFLVFDVETTGLNTFDTIDEFTIKRTSRVVQLGWLLLDIDFGLIKEECYLLKQPRKMPPKAFSVHGISKERTLLEGKEPQEVLEMFLKDLEKIDTIVAHNIVFDAKIVEFNLLKHGLKAKLHTKTAYCTMLDLTKAVDARTYYDYARNGRLKWPTLSEALSYTIKQDITLDSHDALKDATATAYIFREAVNNDIIFKNKQTKIWRGLKIKNYT